MHKCVKSLKKQRCAVFFIKLPNAPEVEIFSIYGVGIPTERAYIYKLNSATECYIPFQIHSSEGENEENCLHGGVYSVDGDETIPVMSAGNMLKVGDEKLGSIHQASVLI